MDTLNLSTEARALLSELYGQSQQAVLLYRTAIRSILAAHGEPLDRNIQHTDLVAGIITFAPAADPAPPPDPPGLNG